MGPKKEKSAKKSGSEAEETVIQYMEKMNRPYNVQIVVDNLQGTIGKTTMQKILDHYADQGSLTRKEFGKQKLYWRNQETIEVASPDELAEIDKKMLAYEDELEKTKEECEKLASELKAVTALPNNKTADEQLNKLTTENKDLKSKLDAIKSNSIVISAADKKKAEKDYEKYKQLWRKRKRMCRDIVGQLEEGSGKRYKELVEEVGLTLDEEYNVDIEKDKTTRMKNGEL